MGSNGIEKVIELSLTEKETADFQNSVDAVKQLVATMDDLLSA
jgi:malate dehydrogenase